MQTNGTLIDDAWAGFFSQHNYLVGVSVDGPAELHDALRVDTVARERQQPALHVVVLLEAVSLTLHDDQAVGARDAPEVHDLSGDGVLVEYLLRL